MAKPKKARPAKSYDSVWSVPGLEKRCQQLIVDEKMLTGAGGPARLCQTINREFADKLGKLRLTLKALDERLHQLIWTSAVLDRLEKAVRANVSDERLKEFFPYIPEKLLQEKLALIRGTSSSHATAQFVAGMGRFFTGELPPGAEEYEFPENSHAKPYELTAKGDDWSVMVLNGANLGLAHERVIKNNPVRRALSDAEKRGDTVVILTNLFWLDRKKAAGAPKVGRAQVSGLRVNPDFLPPSYRKEARRILKGKTGEIIYQPMSSKFLEVMDGWYKITHRPDEKGPEFTGPVLAVLGYNEEDAIKAAAYHEYRYETILKQQALAVEIAYAQHMRKEARRRRDLTAEKYWAEQVERYTQQKALTIITNVSDPDSEVRRRRIRALVVRKIQEMIPNCTVIGQGTSYVRIGGKVLEINIPPHESVTDGLLADFGDTYGAKVFRDTLADATVICHPWALNHRLVGREDHEKGKRRTKTVHVAPICVDGEFLRERLRDVTKSEHRIVEAVFDPQFLPGVLVVNQTNGIISADALPIKKLDHVAGEATNFAFPYPDVKYIWVYEHTDDHEGSRAKVRVWVPELKRHLGVAETTAQLMRRSGLFTGDRMPVHIMTNNDDPTQGNHFGTHLQPDPLQMSETQLERWWDAKQREAEQLAKKGDTAGVVQLVLELGKFNLGQFLIRGQDWAQSQMLAVFERQLETSVDLYDAVLRRAESARLTLRGVSELTGEPFDNRDVGFINRGTGNHFESTVERTLTEGVFYAKYIIALLKQFPHWNGKADFLERAVRAPLYSNQYFAWGSVQAPGGYEWGLRFISSPARLSSWSDPLQAIVKNDLARGDSGNFMKGRATLTTIGDKHFYGSVHTRHIRYFMCAAGAHTDLYGERGFPPNNSGIGFVGLPAGGPDAGPVLVRLIPHDYLRDFFKGGDAKKEFNWEKFLPNPV